MAEGCGPNCAKFLLFAFNILVFIAGVAMMGVSIWLLVDHNAQDHLTAVNESWSTSGLRAASIAILVVGVIVAAISFCGCCGAIKESACLLLTYAVVLGLLLIIQCAAGITAAVFKSDISNGLSKTMDHIVLTKYGQENEDSLTKLWDGLQVDLHCCGANNYHDWDNSYWKYNQTGTTTLNVPETCCVLKNTDPENPKPKNLEKCQRDAILPHGRNSDYLHTQGCEKAFKDWVHSIANILIGVAFGLGVVLLLGVICACVLGCGSRRRSGYQYV